MVTWEPAPAALSRVEDALDDPNINPWERLPGETAAAYAAFEAYRDMGPGRSVPKVIDMGHSGTSAAWCSKNLWVERCRRWDQHLSRIREQTYINGIEEMAYRHAETAKETLEALMAPVNELNRRVKEDPDRTRAELDGASIGKIMELAQASARSLQSVMNAERISRGLPTEISKKDEEHVHRIEYGDPERLAATLETFARTGVLDALMATGGTGQVIDAEAYELDPDSPLAEADGLPDGSPEGDSVRGSGGGR
jgi:hypothetical protein